LINYDYKMLKQPTGKELMDSLAGAVITGWQAFGSPFFGVEDGEPAFFQAVMKIKSSRG